MSFDNIKLDKGLYTSSKGFTQALEEIDPSSEYIGTQYEGLDAYQRQLKRFDIKVSGKDSDTISKFFQTSDSAALFPEYISRAIRQGMENETVLDKIVATTTEIDSLDYRSIENATPESDYSVKDVSEGAFIPEALIKTKDTLTPLKKRGRMLVASYEAIKFQKLDLFTIMLGKIGDSIAKAQLIDAVSVLKDGMESVTPETEGEISYNDLLKLWGKFENFNLTSMICSGDSLNKILQLDEFRDSAAGLTFHATGSLITPFGAEIIRAGDDVLSSGIIALDKNYALEKIQAGGIVTDYDKLIDRQLERATVSSICGFSKIFPDAVKGL